jgi:hypothetical protein
VLHKGLGKDFISDQNGSVEVGVRDMIQLTFLMHLESVHINVAGI